MPKHIHYEWPNIGPEDTIEVTLDRQANVQLMDDMNYRKYKTGQTYKFFGGTQVKSPAHLSPPHRGKWNLAVDLLGFVGKVNIDVRII